MQKFRQGLAILGCMSLPTFGCASRAADSRLMDALDRAEQAAADHQQRIAELEWRLREIDAQRDAEARRASSREFNLVVDKLDLLIAQNQQILRSQAAPAGAQSAGAALPDVEADPKEQLRFWAERLRASASGFRGGLTPEQNTALNILLRRERRLDPNNPWPDL